MRKGFFISEQLSLDYFAAVNFLKKIDTFLYAGNLKLSKLCVRSTANTCLMLRYRSSFFFVRQPPEDISATTVRHCMVTVMM